MFQQLHYKLTALCALITITILSLFTIIYLSVSEQTLQKNQDLSFQHDFDMVCGAIEQQVVLSHSYLLQLESSGNYYLFLWDKGQAFTFNFVQPHSPYLALSQELYDAYLEQETEADVLFWNLQETAGDSRSFKAAATVVHTGQSDTLSRLKSWDSGEGLALLMLAPQDDFLMRLSRQRLLFGLLALAGCLLLTLFAFVFTGWLLRPIRENQEKQLQFVADASHELRTPLAVILSAIEARPPGFERTIASEARRMGHLTDDLLTLTGLENHSRKLHFDNIAPDTFLLNIYEEWEPVAAEKDLRLSLSLPDDAVPSLWADPERLKQLLLILLQNAVNYTPAGGNLALRLLCKGKYICFQVADNGVGIADQNKEKIFERLYRVDSSRHEKEHFGLGLCLAKEIMQAHQGRIEVSDTPGGGSTFSCYFPITA